MGERFSWHYQAARRRDSGRLILTCNHGTLYHGSSYAEMGARPEIYAAESDGFETGQIMQDGDADLYNLMYCETLTSLGKPYCPRRLAYKKSDPYARGGGTSYTPEAARRYCYESLGADAWHLGLIQWSGSLPDGEWGVKGTPGEKEIAKIFGEIRRLWPLLDDMHAVKPQVAVFLSHPTWALRGFRRSWQELHLAAIEHQLPKLYVYDGQLVAGEANDFATLISLDNELLADGVPEALLRYVCGGGQLIVGGKLGGGPADLSRQVPPELRGSGSKQVGEGRIVFLDTVDPMSVLKAIGESPAPVKISGTGIAMRPTETQIAKGYHDWPQDLDPHESLGQTVTLPQAGLCEVAIRMPTYLRKPPAGFTFQLRAEGPTGKVLASRRVAGGVGDNAWVELEVLTPPSAGQVVYIGAKPDPELPPQHLGWWSTHKDAYPGGQAYVDGKEVPGDRQVKMTFLQGVEVRRTIEAFILSDGLNFGVVLINVSRSPIRPEVDLAGLPYPLPARAYRVTTPLNASQWHGSGLSGSVRLAPHGTAFLYIERRTSPDEARQAVAAAQGCVETFAKREAVTPFARYALDRANDFLNQSRSAKAMALALKACSQLGLAVECPTELNRSDRLVLVAKVYDTQGRPREADRVQAEFVPTPAFRQALRAIDKGIYQLDLPVTALPPRYDYEARKYVPFHGPLQITIRAAAGPFRASRRLLLTIKQ